MLINQLKNNPIVSPPVEASVKSKVPNKDDVKNSAYGLSEREFQVLHYVSDGLNNKEIAEQLYLSEGTVKNYISSIYSKMNVRDRIQASNKANEEGMF
jgi:DNA-binding NarL/FixJ family response regulator